MVETLELLDILADCSSAPYCVTMRRQLNIADLAHPLHYSTDVETDGHKDLRQ